MDVEGKVAILLGQEADTHTIQWEYVIILWVHAVEIRHHNVGIVEDIVSR